MQVVGVVGAGTMGSGIAQVAATAGCRVLLYDVSAQQLERAREQIARFLRRAAERGRMDAGEAEAALARIAPVHSLDDLAPSDVVIEAVPERLDLKREILAHLGRVCPPGTILTTNTSSLSVTALGAASGRPDRFAGMHFFNPAPLMPLVEVIVGDGTSPETAQAVEDLARRFGKTPVRAQDTPGFIVNRVARPFYGEALRILGEGLADVATVDGLVRSAGFRMGPFELMDLIGIDVNFAVTCSVYDAYFQEPRYRPHPIQRRLVEAGALGRKAGRGFYIYHEDAEPRPAVGPATWRPPRPPVPERPARLFVLGRGPAADAFAQRAAQAGVEVERAGDPRPPQAPPELAVDLEPAWGDARARRAARLDLVLPPGVILAAACWGGPLRDVARSVSPRRPVVGFNLWLPLGDAPRVEWVVDRASADVDPALLRAAGALAGLGFEPAWVGDAPGGVVGRIVSMLVNEAAFAVAEGVAHPDAIDTAMRLGTNYPRGPWAWYAGAGPLVRAVLEGLHHHYREERYRPSPLLTGPVR